MATMTKFKRASSCFYLEFHKEVSGLKKLKKTTKKNIKQIF